MRFFRAHLKTSLPNPLSCNERSGSQIRTLSNTQLSAITSNTIAPTSGVVRVVGLLHGAQERQHGEVGLCSGGHVHPRALLHRIQQPLEQRQASLTGIVRRHQQGGCDQPGQFDQRLHVLRLRCGCGRGGTCGHGHMPEIPQQADGQLEAGFRLTEAAVGERCVRRVGVEADAQRGVVQRRNGDEAESNAGPHERSRLGAVMSFDPLVAQHRQCVHAEGQVCENVRQVGEGGSAVDEEVQLPLDRLPAGRGGAREIHARYEGLEERARRPLVAFRGEVEHVQGVVQQAAQVEQRVHHHGVVSCEAEGSRGERKR